ncbi:Integration host factor subunit beta [Candidatus Arsenophonus lipoptenae]|uniref:Integration host factor subunit beta n=1 Tax=Candidatus Arsenophonus lipoptenae TaxID=634113 RepID=A0A0X9VMZ6_9GAMM|nr:integration host factor subunit beta [Candidatus Arsenophonus lipoptenae]AMA65121.1 Integration host factor subunit beta [Candidatus Arsenophonus lipoptenae]
MTRSELIKKLVNQLTHISEKLIENAVKEVLEQITKTLSIGERTEIRGFGSFSVHYLPPRIGRNPKTGEKVLLNGKNIPHFKPGKELRNRVNSTYKNL